MLFSINSNIDDGIIDSIDTRYFVTDGLQESWENARIIIEEHISRIRFFNLNQNENSYSIQEEKKEMDSDEKKESYNPIINIVSFHFVISTIRFYVNNQTHTNLRIDYVARASIGIHNEIAKIIVIRWDNQPSEAFGHLIDISEQYRERHGYFFRGLLNQ
jgi:hypothetical protein